MLVTPHDNVLPLIGVYVEPRKIPGLVAPRVDEPNFTEWLQKRDASDSGLSLKSRCELVSRQTLSRSGFMRLRTGPRYCCWAFTPPWRRDRPSSWRPAYRQSSFPRPKTNKSSFLARATYSYIEGVPLSPILDSQSSPTIPQQWCTKHSGVTLALIKLFPNWPPIPTLPGRSSQTSICSVLLPNTLVI